MKFILLILAIITFSCKHAGEVNTDPMAISDTITLGPKQLDWNSSVNNPRRGNIQIFISNFTDSTKKFVILVKELK